MQVRRTIFALCASVAVFLLWIRISQKIWPEAFKPPTDSQMAQTQPAAGELTAESTTPSASPVTTTTPGQSPPAPATMSAASQADTLIVEGGTDTTPVTLGDANPDSPYPMSIEIVPEGASVGDVRLRGYYQTVKKEEPYLVCSAVVSPEDGRVFHSFVTPKIRFENLKQEALLENVVWQKQKVAKDRVELTVTIKTADEKPLARVTKIYSIAKQPRFKKVKKQTYDMVLATKIENLTDQPLQAILVQQGPIGFKKEQSRAEDRRALGATWDAADLTEPAVEGHDRSDVFKKGQVELGRDEEGKRIAWLAQANQYFACIMAPAGRDGIDVPPIFERADGIHLTNVDDSNFSEDLTVRYITKPITIAAGSTAEVAFENYIGPKSKPTLETGEVYKKRDYYQVISESFYMCAPAALVGVMMNLLNAFYAIPPHNYGLAIIFLVLIVRALLHPITKKSQVNMAKMQKKMSSLQPKIQAAKDKHPNDKAAMNQAVMGVYRDEGVNPAGNILTCLPMMLQLPIWAALWAALSSTVEMRHAPFDGWWIMDMTQPDALIMFSKPITIPLLSGLMGGPMTSFNLLPILLGISQVLQTKLMPRGNPQAQAATGNPDQLEQQRKMMMFMSVFFVFILYNAPSGLNLYIMSSNLFGMLEQWRIRKHLAAEELKEAEMPVKNAEPKKPSWFQRKWQGLQKEAEEARKIQGPKNKKTKSRK